MLGESGRRSLRSRRGGTSSKPSSSPTTTRRGPSRRRRTTNVSSARRIDASDEASVAALVREHEITHVMNAVDPLFNMAIFNGAKAAGADYLDMAMSLSQPHPEKPYELTGVKLGDEQFAVADQWEADGRLALCGIGVEPGLSDVFARYAADHLFSEIDELGHPRRRQPHGHRCRGQRDLRAVVLDVDHDRGVPQPAGHLGEGPRLVHHGAVQRAGGVRLPRGHRPGRVRQRRARRSAPHAALGRLQAGDVQVRPWRRVHQRPQGAQHPRPGPHREGQGQGRRGQPARRGRRGAARPGDRRRRR